jgi:hypothetical protein
MPGRQRATGESTEFPFMKKASAKGMNDELRPEYDLSKLKGGIRGKYYREATAGTNLVLMEHELADVFPDSEAVNRALRMLVNTAAAATGTARRWPGTSSNRANSTAVKRSRLAARGGPARTAGYSLRRPQDFACF